ncbi:hypothetical protein KUTeg_009273 [Tegillarca granosa]|uniref:SWIM-type domain-containing protein n=1 Tax=Tegillarca granosa TaxID=220873 RepID=A0ABQ9F724_TEGGR|nr:hypothetical protein KUTeg_009273 [Tegillarca granosa]
MAALSLDSIPDDFSTTYFSDNFSKKSLSRGLTYFKEGYVHKVTISKGSRPEEINIGGHCYRSMRKGETPHTLSVTLKNKRHICNAYCSCTAGSGGTCSHMSQHYALKLNNSESVTCGNTTFPKDAKVKLPPWYNCLKSNPVNSIEIKQSTRGQHNKN